MADARKQNAYIALETGDIVSARCQSPGTAHGTLVFTTAYTGYEETLTDPSYAKQLLTFAYPLIGNYGVTPTSFQSDTVHPEAVLARQLTPAVTNWLADTETPAVDTLDTRQLVTTIRDHGELKCGIAAGPEATPELAQQELADCPSPSDHTDIGAQVSTDTAQCYNPTGTTATVCVIDCGVKESIITQFTARGCCVHQLPYDASPDWVRSLNPDLVMFSNGPGNPQTYTETQHLAETLAGDIPLTGICLGQQIIAQALGGTTRQMDFGHRGSNHAVHDIREDKVLITSQNHSYTVADAGELTVTHRNVNDESIEGLTHPDAPIWTRQFHVEANPGPRDAEHFFDNVLQNVRE